MKKPISSILVAVDGSSPSFRAADYALELASRYSAKLFLITVTSIPAKYHVTQPDVTQSKEGQREMDDARNWFETYTQKAKQKGIIIWTELVNSHRPVDYVLLEYAEEKNIDLIVTGTRGRNTLGRLLLGSVASRIVTYSHCSVLLAK
jgi:nucleotide-binding universal stress UspA family protein